MNLWWGATYSPCCACPISNRKLNGLGVWLLVQCITCSQFRSEPVKHDYIVARNVLQQHQCKEITGRDEEDHQRICVRRSHLFSDAARGFSRPNFNVSKLLKVVFVDEPSVDEGGPRQEFFQLLMKEAFTSSGLFAGWPQNVVPIHSVGQLLPTAIVGKMIATCLVHARWSTPSLLCCCCSWLSCLKLKVNHPWMTSLTTLFGISWRRYVQSHAFYTCIPFPKVHQSVNYGIHSVMF